MGRIKSSFIKRTAKRLVDESPDIFTEDYEENKKILGNEMPGKRLRNMIAGYITRIKRNTTTIIEEDSQTK